MDGIGFIDAVAKYAQFSGRSRRREYWWFVLISGLLLTMAATFVAIQTNDAYDSEAGTVDTDLITALDWVFIGVFVALWAALVIPYVSVTVRRLHDTGASGWWAILLVVPIIIYIMALFDGTQGPNRFGEDPKNRPAPGA
jgi:uncharacterized membrane protein YhaH (DUF805 family)